MELNADQEHKGGASYSAVLQLAVVALAGLVGFASLTGCCGPASVESQEIPAIQEEQEQRNTAQDNLTKALKLALDGLDDISLQDVLFP